MAFNVIITGASGMVGRGILLECLESPEVAHVLVVNRSPLGISHSKLREVLLQDFQNVASIAHEFGGYDACFFTMGVSSVGMKEDAYTRITFDVVVKFADLLYGINPNLVFNYVSGAGTDSTERGAIMWARVKGRTENYVLRKGFRDAYAFRPGVIVPEKGVKSKTPLYNFLIVLATPFFGLLKKSPSITTTGKIGQAMIRSVYEGCPVKHLEAKDINRLATL